MRRIVKQYITSLGLSVVPGILIVLGSVTTHLFADDARPCRDRHSVAAAGPDIASRAPPVRRSIVPATATPSTLVQPLRLLPADRVLAPAQPYVIRRMRVTGYCPCSECCGRGARGVTANGTRIWNTDGFFVAAESAIPFKTRIVVPGYAAGRTVPVLDRGGRIRTNCIDVYFADHQTARCWGVRWLNVRVYLISH